MKMKILRAAIALLAASALCLTGCLFLSYRDSVAAKKERPVVAAFTTSPDVPETIYFCGKETDMRRYNMREGVDRELTSFTYLHASTMLLFKRANRIFPIIEPILKTYGVPDDFKYLAVIESYLDPRATSPARAAGVWQFLEGTAKSYGLRITPTVDERRHIAKATEAACKYLREAYEKYGDWMNVAVSYNAGMGRISGQLEKQGETSAMNLYLVEETTRYPYRILAIKLIFENPYKYGFVLHPKDLWRPIACEEIEARRDIPDLAAFAREKGITYNDLKIFNPWLRDTKLLTGGLTYKLLIPHKDELYYHSENTYVHERRWVVN
jgi:hypothetical protein